MITDINELLKIEKIEVERNTLIMNLGFGKCGSTSLQSSILPYLPIKKYSYEGRHYKFMVDSQGRPRKLAVNKIETTLSAKLGKQKEIIDRIKDIFKGENNKCGCISTEMLPSEIDKTKKLINIICSNFPELKIIHLFSVREILPMIRSGYYHACAQYMKKNGVAYNINEVVFETIEDARKAGYVHEDEFIPGNKRPIILEKYSLAKTISDLELEALDTFIIDVRSIYTNKNLWSQLFRHIGKNKNEGIDIANQMVEITKKFSIWNVKSARIEKHIDEKYKEITGENMNKIKKINQLTMESLSQVGHYWG